MKPFIIWFIGIITTPIIVAVTDWAYPQFIAIGWGVDETNLTIYGLKFLWLPLWLIMGIIVFANARHNDIDREE